MANKIMTIKLSRLINEKHVQFHENVNSIIEQTTAQTLGIADLYTLYQTALTNERDSLAVIVRSELTPKIVEQDALRDDVFNVFKRTAKNYRDHYDADYRVAANLLWKIFLHYGDVCGKAMDAETAAINDMLREFDARQDLNEALLTLNLISWKEKLAEVNNNFHKLMLERYSETAGRTNLRMKETRGETDKIYHFIVNELEKQILLCNNNSAFNKFIEELNSIIKRFKDGLAQEFGRKNAEKNNSEKNKKEITEPKD